MPSSNLIQAATAPETDAVLLTLLTIYVDGTPTLHLVDNKENIISQGTEFIACSFGAVLPDKSAEGNKSCRLQIDNTDVSIYKTIKNAINYEISCDVAVILSSTPDVYEQGPLQFVLRNITANQNVISAELYDMYMHDRKFTALTYNPDDFPGLFY